MSSRPRHFESKYPGRCGICDDDFDAGDEVAYSNDEVCHSVCADEEYDA